MRFLKQTMTVAMLFIALHSVAFAQDIALSVTGTGFSIQGLKTGSTAFSNRKYLWENVPDKFQGWTFTRTFGGSLAQISVQSQQDGAIYIAVASGPETLPGWTPVNGLEFRYTDKKETMMRIYARAYHAGTVIAIPQIGWAGTLVIAPKLTNTADQRPIPGIVIDHSPDPDRVYLGSPCLVALANGDYVVSLDLFGPGTTNSMSRVFRSRDKGRTWEHISDIHGQWWSTMFLHQGALYTFGTSREYGAAVIRRSDDGGVTWTAPINASSGLLASDGYYCCGPGAVIVYQGRIWRAMEVEGHSTDAKGYRAFVWSAPIGANLLQASSWTMSNKIEYKKVWRGTNWLEGNMVVTPDNSLVNILRVNLKAGETAALTKVSNEGKTLTFDPENDYLAFPGGGTKFTIRYDPQTKRYWSLVNKQQNPIAQRNILALTSSPDLRHWTIETIILSDPDPVYVAFQYVDWQFEGDDIIAASRTAFDGANTYHNANYITFHRIANFRHLHQQQ